MSERIDYRRYVCNPETGHVTMYKPYRMPDGSIEYYMDMAQASIGARQIVEMHNRMLSFDTRAVRS